MDRTELVRTAMQAIDTAASEIDPDSTGNHLVNFATAAVDALLPEITDASQMANVPPFSWVAVRVMGGVEVLEWDGSRLNGGLRIDNLPQLPEKVIAMYGPITVVAQP